MADIHFDYRLAVAAIENGVDKIRINPGNIGSRERVKAVVDAAKARRIPIRVGVNSGSLEKDLIAKYGGCLLYTSRHWTYWYLITLPSAQAVPIPMFLIRSELTITALRPRFSRWAMYLFPRPA